MSPLTPKDFVSKFLSLCPSDSGKKICETSLCYSLAASDGFKNPFFLKNLISFIKLVIHHYPVV